MRDNHPLPISLVPTPTRQFNRAFDQRQSNRQSTLPALKLVRSTDRDDAAPAAPPPGTEPPRFASRALIYKQDPTVEEIGIRKILLNGAFQEGPRSARIEVRGVSPVAPNAMNDFIQAPGTEGFDTVHTFSIVHEALAMCQRTLGKPIRWQWNGGGDSTPIEVFPRAGETMNAFYSRDEQCLKFFFFEAPGPTPATVFTCRSFDIVAHEAGHAILDSLQPDWLDADADPQCGALHEAFGDLIAIFLALSQSDQVEALIVQTKGDLHNKTFLSDLAEEFGLALGRDNGLRNADNDKRMSEVSSEVHDLSQVFTGGIYDVLADAFELERGLGRDTEAQTLMRVSQTIFSLVLEAFRSAPERNASFADVVSGMAALCPKEGQGPGYRRAILNQFARREVIDVKAAAGNKKGASIASVRHAHLGVKANGLQDRSGCCGTLRLREYSAADRAFAGEVKALADGLGGRKATAGGTQAEAAE
ncbi:gluzincin family metallopeptidase [Allosphingosinicella deserti]|uniref:Peptidase M4 domain-containing protein n=1 Tax=Allosphingosinicella deserti TaxID=2116704 RepID=A0A2P7QR57_9SPHN|nr:hypothetical protein [Sphingomonas deserti]PSJ40458.1 hypothetical protein C7I55_08970 [Sphingomonas deserti]